MNRKLIIVGPTPEPNGGVVSFIEDITTELKANNIDYRIIDLYPGKKKDKRKKNIYLGSINSVFRLLYFSIYISFQKETIVWFNFSSNKSLKLFLFIIKRKSNKWLLTLHHGVLPTDKKIGNLLHTINNYALIKFDLALYLSEKQHVFYSRYISNTKKLISFSIQNKLDSRVLNDPKNISRIIMSGYPSAIYNYFLVIELVQKINYKYHLNIAVKLYIYGDDFDKKSIFYSLNSISSNDKNISYCYGLNRQDFMSSLKKSDCYVRATSEDSFGIALKEALSLGLIVIASDVCKRAIGSYIYNYNNNDQLYDAMKCAILGEKIPLPREQSTSNQIFINDIKNIIDTI